MTFSLTKFSSSSSITFALYRWTISCYDESCACGKLACGYGTILAASRNGHAKWKWWDFLKLFSKSINLKLWDWFRFWLNIFDLSPIFINAQSPIRNFRNISILSYFISFHFVFIPFQIKFSEKKTFVMLRICLRTIELMNLNLNNLKSKYLPFLQSNEITEPLTPLIQVASLLQARKETDQDVQVILEICSTLSTAQVIKVSSMNSTSVLSLSLSVLGIELNKNLIRKFWISH